MCCFCLHFSDFIALFFQKIKTCCSLLLKKITCCAKREKKITCHEEKFQPPPWISNGPSLIIIFLAWLLCVNIPSRVFLVDNFPDITCLANSKNIYIGKHRIFQCVFHKVSFDPFYNVCWRGLSVLEFAQG